MRYVLIICVVFLYSCDKFTGYDYSAESIGVHSTIHGTVTNIFTSDPVKNAQMIIGDEVTSTDDKGSFSLSYLIGIDEQRDKPVRISVTAPNYYILDTTLVIVPPDMEFNISMIYAAPIIEKAWWGSTPFFVIVNGEIAAQPATQVLIHDNQGIANIDTVYTIFYYTKMGSPEIRVDTVGMKFISQLSNNRAYYQAIGIAHLGEGFLYYSRIVDICVFDEDGFSDTISERDVTYFTDQPLFPIVFN